MKLTQLSMVALLCGACVTTTFAADTLIDAFKNGKVNGELKAYYFDRDNGNTSADIFNAGIMLQYKTDTFNGFGLNLTAQTNHAPSASKASKEMFIGDEYGSGVQLSEAYISYAFGNTMALVGRMFLETPLVASNGSRMVKDAFEGAAIINQDIPGTTLGAGYVDKYQARTNGKGDIGKFEQVGAEDDGAYTIFAINESISGLTLTGAYADVTDAVSILYTEAMYVNKVSQMGYLLGAQYYGTKYDDALLGNDSAKGFGIKAGLSLNGINTYIAYSKVGDDGRYLTSGLGGGADLMYTGSVILSDSYRNNTKAYAADVNYDVTNFINIGMRYVLTDDDDKADLDAVANANAASYGKVSYTGFYGSYDFEGALKNLSVGAEYDRAGRDGDGDELRLKANYKF